MAHSVSEFYTGSLVLSDFSDYVGLPVDQVNFVVCQISALFLASLFRTTLHPNNVTTTIRHGFSLLLGLFIGFFCFGPQAIHLLSLPALCFVAIKTQNPHIVQRIVLVIALLYLSLNHLYRQIYDYGSYTLDITGPLMVITQKVTSLAFHLHDGLTKDAENLSKSQNNLAIKRVPTILEYFSFVMHFPSILAGPVIFYKDYIEFIEGTIYTNANANSGSSKTAQLPATAPSPFRAVCRKTFMSLFCVLIFIKLLPFFPIDRVKEPDFIHTTVLYKLLYLFVSTTMARFKYYFAWMLADAICNNSGMGYNGVEDGIARWDKFSNVDIVKFEMSTNLRESIEAWNIGTNRWLRMVVYERTEKYPTILTYALSALWHGFYPGYYLTFANGALFTFAARTMRRTIRDYFTENAETKFLYDVLTFVITKLVMLYITFPFVLLEFWPGVYVYMSLYWCLHLGALCAICIVPRLVPKANKASTKSNFVQTIYDSRPLTNGVSRHHN